MSKYQELNEETEFWREQREQYKVRRAKRLPIRQKQIESLAPEYKIEKKSEYHYRINDVLDVFPVNNKYHVLALNKRGKYNNINNLLRRYCVRTQS